MSKKLTDGERMARELGRLLKKDRVSVRRMSRPARVDGIDDGGFVRYRPDPVWTVELVILPEKRKTAKKEKRR